MTMDNKSNIRSGNILEGENAIEAVNEDEKALAVENRKKLEAAVNDTSNPWNYSATGLEARNAARSMLATKSGLYARIPIICKADNCPYNKTCMLLEYGLAPYGERCAFETALIEQAYEGYKRDFNLDEEASFTDLTIVKSLINCDVMIERAQALLSIEGVAIEQVYAGSNERTGEDFYDKSISKALELYERHTKQRERLLDLMNATRKAKLNKHSEDDSSILQTLRANLNSDFIIEEVPDKFKK